MKFKVDENLPVEAADSLRQAGYDAASVSEQRLEGSLDSDIASVCQREGRALITLGTDFADIRAYPPEQYPGLIVLRLRRQDKPHVLEILGRLVLVLSREPLEHFLGSWMKRTSGSEASPDDSFPISREGVSKQ